MTAPDIPADQHHAEPAAAPQPRALLGVDPAGDTDATVVVLAGGFEYGVIERFRYITSDFIPPVHVALGMPTLPAILADVLKPYQPTSRPDIAAYRRKVFQSEKAARKVLPRGRR